MSLFTSPPTTEKVTNYVKPLFITITTVAVIFTRYASVFPLSEAINFFHKHARGQRTEELPHSYQMMLFWAGLRGAVGVALAAGFKGQNAQTLRTTVLVVVVLTVVMFGGTTLRMLEVLGIRTGVEDEAASSSEDEDGPANRGPWNARRNSGSRWGRYMDDESGPNPSYRAFVREPGRIRPQFTPNSYNHQAQTPPSPLNNNTIFSAASSESLDSDGEVLPMAATSGNGGDTTTQPRTDASLSPTAVLGEDGKWFQALDQRYLLPLFSNATASRTFHARRARRTASGINVSTSASPMGTPVESEDEGDTEVELGGVGSVNGSRSREFQPIPSAAQVDESRFERGLGSPILRTYSSDGQNRSSS